MRSKLILLAVLVVLCGVAAANRHSSSSANSIPFKEVRGKFGCYQNTKYPVLCTANGARLCCARGYVCHWKGECVPASETSTICRLGHRSTTCNGGCCSTGTLCNPAGECITKKKVIRNSYGNYGNPTYIPFKEIPNKFGCYEKEDYPVICTAARQPNSLGKCCRKGYVCYWNGECVAAASQKARSICKDRHQPVTCNGGCCPKGMTCTPAGKCHKVSHGWKAASLDALSGDSASYELVDVPKDDSDENGPSKQPVTKVSESSTAGQPEETKEGDSGNLEDDVETPDTKDQPDGADEDAESEDQSDDGTSDDVDKPDDAGEDAESEDQSDDGTSDDMDNPDDAGEDAESEDQSDDGTSDDMEKPDGADEDAESEDQSDDGISDDMDNPDDAGEDAESEDQSDDPEGKPFIPFVEEPGNFGCWADPNYPVICTAMTKNNTEGKCCHKGYMCHWNGTCLAKAEEKSLCKDAKLPVACNGGCCPAGSVCTPAGKCHQGEPDTSAESEQDADDDMDDTEDDVDDSSQGGKPNDSDVGDGDEQSEDSEGPPPDDDSSPAVEEEDGTYSTPNTDEETTSTDDVDPTEEVDSLDDDGDNGEDEEEPVIPGEGGNDGMQTEGDNEPEQGDEEGTGPGKSSYSGPDWVEYNLEEKVQQEERAEHGR